MYVEDLARPASRISVSVTERQRLHAYFRELKNPGVIHQDIFENRWTALHRNEFSTQETVQILKWTAEAIKNNCGDDQKIQLRNIVSKNWDCWETAAIDQVGFFSAQDCRIILNACDTLGIRPSKDFMSNMNRQLKRLSSDFNAHSYSVIFQSMAKIGLDAPIELRHAFLHHVQNSKGFLHGIAKTPILWSCAVQDSMHPNQGYREMAEVLRPRLRPTVKSKATQKQRYDSHLWFGWDMEGQVNPNGSGGISSGEVALTKHFQSLNLSTDTRKGLIPALPQAIDAAVFHRGTRILTETNGPTHYVNLSLDHPYELGEDLNGTTKFRSALMQQQEPDDPILHISSRLAEVLYGHKGAKQLSHENRKGLTFCFLNGALNASAQTTNAYVRQEHGTTLCGAEPFLPRRA